MKHILNFIPQSVRHLRDWGDFVLKSTYQTFVDSVADAMLALQEEQQLQANTLATKLDTVGGDARYGQLGAANTWTVRQDFNGSFITRSAPVNAQGAIAMGVGGTGVGELVLGNAVNGLWIKKTTITVGQISVNGATHFRDKTGIGIGTTSPSAQIHLVNSVAAEPAQILQGAASQTAPLQKSQLVSSTGTVRDASAIDTIWTDATDATRTAELRESTPKSGTMTEVRRSDHFDSATQTNFMLRHNGTLKRVEVGAADSGGAGYRALRIAN